MKTTSCTENIAYAFNNAPRGARTKRNNGSPCRSPAIKGKNRCRIHGGSKGSGGQLGNTNAQKQGYTTKVVKQFRVVVKIATHNASKLIKILSDQI